LRGTLKSPLSRVELSIEEKKLIDDLLKYPLVLRSAFVEKASNKVLEYAVDLSLDFNKFYEKHSVVFERDEGKKRVRALITVLVLLVISEPLDILGFPKPIRI
jgi:arginyl-tRNA synthetase